MNKIRKGDQVIVLTGRDKGKRGTVLQRVDEERLIVEGVNVVKKHVKPNPMKGTTGGVVDKTHADPPVQRGDLQCRDRQGRPRRHQAVQRRRQEVAQDASSAASACSSRAAKRSRLRGSPWLACKQFYREKVVPDLIEKFGYKSTMQVPRITKITLNMGVERGGVRQEGHGQRRRRPDQDRRPEAGRHQVEEGDRRLQDPRRRADRLHGHAARRAHVRVPRPLRHDRAAARARLPRHLRSRAFDGRGNYNIGVKEQIIFPEIEYDKIDALRGLNISITTTAKTDEECKALLAAFKFPVQELKAPTWPKLSLIQRETQARRNWSPSTRRSTPS